VANSQQGQQVRRSTNGQYYNNGQRQGQTQQRSVNGQRVAREGSQQTQGRRVAGEGSQQTQGQRRPSNGQQSIKRPVNNNNNIRHDNINHEKRKKAEKKKRNKIVLFIVEIVVLLVVLIVAVGIWFNSKTDMIQHVEIVEEDVAINQEVQEAIDSGESVLKGYRNIALFGVDSRDGELEKNTRTDTIMIASINLDTNEVRLCSIMRDTWLNLSTDSYSKANAAYAKGGPQQAISMLNMNLDLNITDFVTIGFDGLIDAIDAVGGVEIDVKEAEIVHINSYQKSILGKTDGTYNAAGEPNYVATEYVDYTPVTTAGTQTLNGLQATAYCRVRYVGDDFERTSRQRTVLTKLAKKAMTLNVSKLNSIADAVFPQVYTSLTKSEIISLLAGIASYSIGDNSNFPFDGYVKTGRIGSASVVVPVDLTKNVSLLHEFLFGEEDYEPSETVKKCSQKIVSDSGMSYQGD
jgi:LCP family protein required for cell wall assembly